MKALRLLIVLFLVILLLPSTGCLKKSITDDQIEEAFQVWLDTPFVQPETEIELETVRSVEGAPRNLQYEDYLKPEERAAIEDEWQHYKNILKIQLVEDTPEELWEKIGSKCVRAFALSCRDASYLEQFYVCELRIMAEVADNRDNFLVGEIQFSNMSERITPNLYMPSSK